MTKYVYQLDFEPATNSRSGLVASYTVDFSVDINWLFNNRGSYNADNDSGSSLFIDNSFSQDGVTVYAGANELVRFVPPYAQQMLTIEGYANFLISGGSGTCDVKIYNELQPENLFQRTDSITSFLQSPSVYGAVKGDLLVIDLLGRFLPANNPVFLSNNSTTYFDAGGTYAPPLTNTTTSDGTIATYLRDDIYRQAVMATSTNIVFEAYQGVGQNATKQSFTQDINAYKTWGGNQPNTAANVAETNLYYWIACYRFTGDTTTGTLLLRVDKSNLTRTAIVAINNTEAATAWTVGGTRYNKTIFVVVDDYDTDQVSILANGGTGHTANYYHFRFNGTLITDLSPLLFTRGTAANPNETLFVYNEGGLAFVLDTNTTPRLFVLDPQTQTIIATQALTGITVSNNKYTLDESALAPTRFGSLLVFPMVTSGSATLVIFDFTTRAFSTLILGTSGGEPWLYVHNDELLASFLSTSNVLTVARVNAAGTIAGTTQLTLTSPNPLSYVFYDPRGYLFLRGDGTGVGICVYDIAADTLVPYAGNLPSDFTFGVTSKFFVPPVDPSTHHGTLAALIVRSGVSSAPTALASFPRTVFGVSGGGHDIAVTGDHTVNTSYEPTSQTFDFNSSSPVGNRGLVFRNQISLRGLQP